MLAHFTARITPFGKDRLVRLWLPEGAMEGSDAYPVVYMFDGHNLFRDEWATYGTCWGLADFLARWEKQVIVVAPECDLRPCLRAGCGTDGLAFGGAEALCGQGLAHHALPGDHRRRRQFHGRIDGDVRRAAP